MGNVVSDFVKKYDNVADTKLELTETLNFMKQMLEANRIIMNQELDRFQEKNALKVFTLSYDSAFFVNASKDAGVDGIIDSFAEGATKAAVVNLIKRVITAMLDSGSMGENKKIQTFFTIKNGSVFRYDCLFYYYRFQNVGVYSRLESCLFVSYHEMVVDIQDKNSIVIVRGVVSKYFTEAMSDDIEGVKKVLAQLKDLFSFSFDPTPEPAPAPKLKAAPKHDVETVEEELARLKLRKQFTLKNLKF
jgi:hypothetical protein